MYSPQFSDLATVSVRRLAWAKGKTMTSTVDYMVGLLPSIVKPLNVCHSCQDKTKCKICIFSSKYALYDQV
jgi:hypothetical protein